MREVNNLRKVNGLLADLVGMCNAVIAIVIAIACVAIGLQQGGLLGAAVGALFGGALAVAVCGLLAIFLEIREELVSMNQHLLNVERTGVSDAARSQPSDTGRISWPDGDDPGGLD